MSCKALVLGTPLGGSPSPLCKMVTYLHIAYICISATAGYADMLLHSRGFSVLLLWQIQVLHFGTLWVLKIILSICSLLIL